MKNIKTKTGEKRRFNLFLFLLPFLFISFIACSSGEDAVDFSHDHHKHYKTRNNFYDAGSNKFSFKDSGDRYKVKFRDGEIYKLYINGDRIPDDEIYKYEDIVYKKREELRASLADLEDDWKDCEFDMEELRESLSSLKEINRSELREAMREVKRELKKIDREEISVDVDLDELHENLAQLKNIKVDFDMDEFHRSMEDLADNLSNIRVEISDNDWSDFREGMRNLKDELKNLDIDMGDLKFEMKKLKRFMKDFRNELIDDGYLEYGDDDFDMEFNKNELIINGRKLPDNLFKKYKTMYKEHFGREMDDDFRFRN